MVVAALGGAYYYMTSQGPTPPAQTTTAMTETTAAQTTAPPATTAAGKPVLRYLGYPFFLPQDAVKQWETLTGQTIEATFAEAFVIGQKQLANLNAWDFGGSLRHRPLVTADALLKMPLSNIPRWQDPTKIEDTFIHPEKYFSAAQAKRFNFLLWADQGKSSTTSSRCRAFGTSTP